MPEARSYVHQGQQRRRLDILIKNDERSYGLQLLAYGGGAEVEVHLAKGVLYSDQTCNTYIVNFTTSSHQQQLYFPSSPSANVQVVHAVLDQDARTVILHYAANTTVPVELPQRHMADEKLKWFCPFNTTAWL